MRNNKEKQLSFYKEQTKDILNTKSLKNINSNLDLIKQIEKYYTNEHTKNQDFLKYEKIILQNEIGNIREKNRLARYIAIISLSFTILLSIISTSTAYENQSSQLRKSQSESRVQALENMREDLIIKKLELENKIKFTNDNNEKNQLQDYEQSIMKEYDNLGKEIIYELDNEMNGNNFVMGNKLSSMIYILYIPLWMLSILYFIEEFTNNKNHYKKLYLEMRLKIVESIFKE